MTSGIAVTRARRRTTAVLVSMIAVAACQVERTPRAGLSDPAAIARGLIENELIGYQASLEQNDALRAAAYFTPEARLQPPLAADVRGRAAITGAMQAAFRDARVIDIEMRSDGIDVAGRLAHQFGTFRQVLRDDNGTERTETGRFVMRWRRTAESAWQIDRLMINHYPPDSAVAAR